MNTSLKSVEISMEAPYYTSGKLSEKTEAVWIVFHGYGQRSEFFMRRFDVLPPNHYLLAPQGLSRFYLDEQYKNVGASWMTKEQRLLDIKHQTAYLDAMMAKEFGDDFPKNIAVNLFGFSQGVATLARWMVHRQLAFHKLILWGGQFPSEIEKEQLSFVSPKAEIHWVVGQEDVFFTNGKDKEHFQYLQKMFGNVRQHTFSGGHEVKREVIKIFTSTSAS